MARQLHFRKAAESLAVAQPALSRQMKDLEDELQTPLFERGRRGVQLTRAGKVFYQRARAIVRQAAEAANEARTAEARKPLRYADTSDYSHNYASRTGR